MNLTADQADTKDLPMGVLLTLAKHHADEALKTGAMVTMLESGHEKMSRLVLASAGRSNGMSTHQQTDIALKAMRSEVQEHMDNLIHCVEKIKEQL
jgi:hypothetical protein